MVVIEPLELADLLDDEHQRVLDRMPSDLLDLSDIAATRERFAIVLDRLRPPELPDNVTISEASAVGIDGAPDVRLKVYRPDGLTAGAPALCWIHGGGMVLGSADGDDHRCAVWAAALPALVVSVDYRLAPEHPYPAPLDDCYAGLCWVADNASNWIRPGSSAGSCFATAASSRTLPGQS